MTSETHRIFDIHHHVPEVIPDKPGGGYDAEKNVAYHLKVMDGAGVRAGAILASLLYERPNGVADTRRMNDFVAWYRDSNRERFPRRYRHRRAGLRRCGRSRGDRAYDRGAQAGRLRLAPPLLRHLDR